MADLRTMWRPAGRNLAIVAATIMFLGSVAFVPDLFNANSGLQQAEPMGPYLNGMFTADAPTPGGDSVTYTIENAFPNLTFVDPVKLLELPTGEMMVFGKPGLGWIFPNDPAATSKTLFLDVSAQTQVNEDGGMLGAVLHPEFGVPGAPNEHTFYVWYRYHPLATPSGSRHSCASRDSR